MSTVTVCGRQVRYRLDGTGTPVVLLHGIGRSLEDWTELAIRLLLRSSRYGARRIERSLFHDPSFVTPARVEHTFALAQRPHAARVLLETARALGTIRGVRAQWRTTLLRSLAELDKPTLILWGDRDLILPATHLNAARTHLPHAQAHLFPSTGHMPPNRACRSVQRTPGKLLGHHWPRPASRATQPCACWPDRDGSQLTTY